MVVGPGPDGVRIPVACSEMEMDGVDAGVDPVGVIELELIKLVRYLETFGRRSDLYIRVDRAGYVMLRTLDRLGPTSVNALADELHLDASTVTRQAASLEGAGFVDRRPDPGDRRCVSVLLTPAGGAAMAEVERERRRLLQGLIGGWTASERDSFGGALSRLNLALEDTRSTPAGPVRPRR
jgi:DNA-binding MarR family transcriptional regulator